MIDTDRRFTLPYTMRMCMDLAEVTEWDVDVAAEEECHWAPKWFGIKEDGLKSRWTGRVWCNPPYSEIEPWVVKAHASMAEDALIIAMLLPCRTEQPWWQKHVESVRDRGHGFVFLTSHFLPKRIRFGSPSDRLGKLAGSPTWNSVLLVWRRPRIHRLR